MTEPGPDRAAASGWRGSNLTPGWLRRRVRVSWKSIVIVLGTLAAVGLAVLVFVVAGGVDVSADRPDSWLTEHALHFVFNRSVNARSKTAARPGDLDDPSRIRLAAQHFDMVCANCHGRPGFGQSVVGLSMSPRPQYLPKVVGQFTDADLFEIVEHGVKYSAMPAWAASSRDDEAWSMVAFLRRLPKLDAAAYRQMAALAPQPASAAPVAAGQEGPLRPANADRNTPPLDEFLYAAPASGFSDQDFHQDPTATCTRCHGADGSGAATGGEAPNLTLQDAAYLRAALGAYTRGDRKSGFMQTVAAQLTDAQVAALADHYAGLPVKTVSAPSADPALVERGRVIAMNGLRERALPACAICHESQGAMIAGAPHIAGQSSTFLRRQLTAMRVGGRGSTGLWNPMSAVTHALGDADIAAVTAYYASQPPAKAAGANATATAPPRSVAAVDLGKAGQIFQAQCVKCHLNGGRGDRAGDFPDLTLQSAPYVAQTLYAFHARTRPNEQMRDIIDALSFDEMAGLARYVGALTPQPSPAKPDPAGVAARGAAIAMRGAPDRGVPACLSCHDARATAALPLIPHLQGQSAPYMSRRLDNFSKLYDVNRSALNPMPAIAAKLTPAERSDLAAYFAAAAPVAKPAAGR